MTVNTNKKIKIDCFESYIEVKRLRRLIKDLEETDFLFLNEAGNITVKDYNKKEKGFINLKDERYHSLF